MNMPGFSAEASLYQSSGYCLHGRTAGSHADSVVPAIPFCGNCDEILANCRRNGYQPRALCTMCATHNCFNDPPDFWW
jgi:hypothetical protein